MRNLIKILAILISILVFCSCNKEETEQEVITYPTILTSSATEITRTTAVTGGSITSDGGSNIIARGVCWRANAVPTLGHYRNTYDGKGMGSFISVITELSPNTTYFIRAYATNSLGTEYGDTISFTTQPAIDPTSIPILRTFEVTSITENCVTSGGFMTYENVNEVVDTISTRGVCWSTTPNPTIEDSNSVDGKGKGSFNSCLTGLEPLTTYYIRAYSINNLGVGYGDQITFTTLASIPTGTVTDIEGNVYKTIIIGEQNWMAENLRTTHFKDGSTIPIVTTDTYQWDNSQTPNYCWYNYDEESYKDIYGALYNWYTVNIGNICPEGWRVPTYNDWITLITFLGG
jgi:hypothetical protein